MVDPTTQTVQAPTLETEATLIAVVLVETLVTMVEMPVMGALALVTQTVEIIMWIGQLNIRLALVQQDSTGWMT